VALPAFRVPPPPGEDTPAEVQGQDLLLALEDRAYRIRGWQKPLNPETLKVNLMVTRGEHFHVDTLDLYQAKARTRTAFIKQAGLELSEAEDRLKLDLGKVLRKLEAVQADQLAQALAAKTQHPALSEPEHAAALALLKSPDLMARILRDFEALGIVGEESNKLTGYLAAVSRLLDRPLALMIQSASAAGKSSLMDAVLDLLPEEDVVRYSAMSGQSLFYMGDRALQHKILAIAEEEGARQAGYALKLLQSEGRVTMASTGKDPVTGMLMTHDYVVEGPVMLFLTTTAIDLDEELLNRCLVLTVNESREQTRAIHALQRHRETLEGLLAKTQRDSLLKLHRNAQRLLQPLAVVNPYADQLSFRDDQTRSRRDHVKYLALIRSIALLHQYQRDVKSHGDLRFLEVTLSDIELANELAQEVPGRTVDELLPQARKLLTLLNAWVAIPESSPERHLPLPLRGEERVPGKVAGNLAFREPIRHPLPGRQSLGGRRQGTLCVHHSVSSPTQATIPARSQTPAKNSRLGRAAHGGRPAEQAGASSFTRHASAMPRFQRFQATSVRQMADKRASDQHYSQGTRAIAGVRCDAPWLPDVRQNMSGCRSSPSAEIAPSGPTRNQDSAGGDVGVFAQGNAAVRPEGEGFSQHRPDLLPCVPDRRQHRREAQFLPGFRAGFGPAEHLPRPEQAPDPGDGGRPLPFELPEGDTRPSIGQRPHPAVLSARSAGHPHHAPRKPLVGPRHGVGLQDLPPHRQGPLAAIAEPFRIHVHHLAGVRVHRLHPPGGAALVQPGAGQGLLGQNRPARQQDGRRLAQHRAAAAHGEPPQAVGGPDQVGQAAGPAHEPGQFLGLGQVLGDVARGRGGPPGFRNRPRSRGRPPVARPAARSRPGRAAGSSLSATRTPPAGARAGSRRRPRR
jgi:hypothetical protein